MSTITERSTETTERTDSAPPLIHVYPRDPAHRLSGVMECPQPGDIALCGFVKKCPQLPGEFNLASVSCVVCGALGGYA